MSFDKLTQSSERIEKLLGKRKRSFYIELSGNSSYFSLDYYPNVNLEGSFEIALTSLSTYFNTPNVDSTNNSLKIFDGTTWTTVSIPEGSYNIDDIAAAINVPQIKLSANLSTLKAVLELTAPYKVDFNVANTIGTMLGFERKVYDQLFQVRLTPLTSLVSQALELLLTFQVVVTQIVQRVIASTLSFQAYHLAIKLMSHQFQFTYL